MSIQDIFRIDIEVEDDDNDDDDDDHNFPDSQYGTDPQSIRPKQSRRDGTLLGLCIRHLSYKRGVETLWESFR